MKRNFEAFCIRDFCRTRAMGTLRGDPLLWKYLKNYYAAIELPYPVEHLKEDILRIFKDFTGELPVREKYYFVKEFSKNCNCIKYGDNAMKEFFLRIVSIC